MKEFSGWSRLDNAAKIFPPTSTKKDPRVFRLACELFEEVEQPILTMALHNTLEQFPLYKSILKKGLFWFYLEESTLTPVVVEETNPPCSPIYHAQRKRLLFQVTYFKKRINLEVYHVLADGAGGLQFLKTLVLNYLKQKYGDAIDPALRIDYDASLEQKQVDSFSKYYTKPKSGFEIALKEKPKKAHKIRAERFSGYRLGVVEVRTSVKGLVALVRQQNATMSEFLTTLLICAIHEKMTRRDEGRPVVITIPVNLRSYFPTVSARNFFGVINISHNFSTQGRSFEDVLKNVKQSFKLELAPERIEQKMNKLSALEHSYATRMVPLSFKMIFMKFAYAMAEKEVTSAVSNLGYMDMPDKVKPYIKMFNVFDSTKKLQICLCSYEDIMTISFTTGYQSTDIQRSFVRMLTDSGLDVQIVSNMAQVDTVKKQSQHCRNCRINLVGYYRRCPLCQGELTVNGVLEENVFPVQGDQYQRRTLLSWIAFGAVSISAISIAVNISLPVERMWSLFVVGGVASLWVSFRMAVRTRYNIPKTILWQVCIVSALALVWDLLTGYHQWSVNFVIPIISTCAIISMVAAAKVLKIRTEDYMIYILLESIFGIVPILLIVLGVVQIVVPSAVCFACSAISLAALVFLKSRSLKAEIQRRLHL